MWPLFLWGDLILAFCRDYFIISCQRRANVHCISWELLRQLGYFKGHKEELIGSRTVVCSGEGDDELLVGYYS